MILPDENHLKEFIELSDQIKKLTSRLDAIKTVLKNRGTFYTQNYACIVYEQSQERLAGLEKFLEMFTRETLEQNNLINHITFKVVKVSQTKTEVRAKVF